jgi:ATP-dependent DNA ligase
MSYDVGVLGSKKNSNKAATFVTPMAAQSVTELPEDDDWLYELKLDGHPTQW